MILKQGTSTIFGSGLRQFLLCFLFKEKNELLEALVDVIKGSSSGRMVEHYHNVVGDQDGSVLQFFSCKASDGHVMLPLFKTEDGVLLEIIVLRKKKLLIETLLGMSFRVEKWECN